MSEHKKLTIKELKKIVGEIVDDYMGSIDNVILDIKQDVLREIEYEGLDYKEGVFGALADLVLIEVIKQLECYI